MTNTKLLINSGNQRNGDPRDNDFVSENSGSEELS